MAEMVKGTTKAEEMPKRDTNWPKVLFQLYIHASFLYGFFFLVEAKLMTLAFIFFIIFLGVLGATAGAHRLWAHHSYTATTSLKFFLMLCHTLGGNGPIFDWVLDHRIHHKFHGTDDDPYNYKRGFYYAHLITRVSADNPKKAELVKQIDMSDIESDKIVMFQKRFYWVLMPIVSLLLPVNTPVEYWGESMLVSIMSTLFFRIPIMLHAAWLINSARSVWGLLPNDSFFSESNLVFLIKKSHWHAYHYTVPWDCLTGEFGSYNSGCTTAFIKIWTIMGLASDIKTIDSKGITMALEAAVDSKKPISECMTEAREQMLLFQHEDNTLNIINTNQTRVV